MEVDMLDLGTSKDHEVWGIPVAVRPNGRRCWPNAVKALAAQKVAEGERIEDVALAAGAHPSLVAKWVSDSKIEVSPQGFVEVLQAKPKVEPTGIGNGYQIRIGDVEINIASGALPTDLAEVLRAVRASL
jgi:hypothetical protein